MVSKLYKLINAVFCVWMFIIIVGAIRSNNLDITNLGKTSIVLIILSIIFFFLYIFKKNLFDKIFEILRTYKKILLIISILLLVVYQLLIVIFMHFPIGHDVSMIQTYLNAPTHKISEYFSVNSNNLFVLFFLRFWTAIFNISPTWINLDIINLIMVDISAIINVLIIKKIQKKYVYVSLFINCVWLLFFPHIIIPYTDTLVLPFVSFAIYMFVCAYIDKKNKVSYLLLFTIFVALAYLLKPSSICFVIALALLTLFKIDSKNIKLFVRLSSIALLLFVGIILGFKAYTLNQNFVKIDYSQSKPMVHFINMGMHDETKGGFNGQVTLELMRQPTKDAKIKYSIDGIKDQFIRKGFFGELKRLINKNFYNTEDGAFGWIKEGDGTFIVWDSYKFERKPVYNKKITNFLVNIYSPNGKYVTNYIFWNQVVWIILLLCMFGSCFVYSENFYISFCQLSLIGGLMFLLIFEGGRTRYLIQFLPIMLMLSSLVVGKYIKKI